MLGNKNIYFTTALILGGIFLFALVFTSGHYLGDDTNSVMDSTVGYDGYITVATTGDFEGRETPAHEGINEIVVKDKHNLLYNLGKNMSRDLLLFPTELDGNISIISLCNATNGTGCLAPAVGDNNASKFDTYQACGLSEVAGKYSLLSAYDGNATISTTFTSSCDGRETNQTRLLNRSMAHFAAAEFTEVTLQTNDQLTVNWTVSVT